MMDAFTRGLLTKFPQFDPAWPLALQEQWFRLFARLLGQGEPQLPLTAQETGLVLERARRMWAEAYLQDLADECGKADELWTWQEERDQGQWVRKAGGAA